MLKKCFKKLSRVQVIAFSFLFVIAVGTILLLLPCSSKTGQETSFLTALFTATSATCVTGLVAADTYTHWTLFGQIVILLLIQIGGLGFITIASIFFFMTKKKISLNQREMLHDSINSMQVGGIVRLTKKILAGTALVEGVGAILLAIRFIPLMGVGSGIFYGIFHSVSAFCNGGFDLMGRYEEYSSFCMFYGDWYVTLILSALILIGGIGFIVWDDVTKYKFHWKQYTLHSKIALSVSAALVIVPSILFFFTEYNGIMKEFSLSERLCASLFSAVTPRTAGFNSIDTAGLSDSGSLLTILLMFIGGCPGSTAGGIKTTTILVIILSAVSSVRQTESTNVFGRRLEESAIKKASAVFFINLTVAVTVTLIICFLQPIPFLDVLFETVSAISTVGMTTGITRQLSAFSKLLIILLMYCGRVGSMSFALAFMEKKTPVPVRMPVEKFIIG